MNIAYVFQKNGELNKVPRLHDVKPNEVFCLQDDDTGSIMKINDMPLFVYIRDDGETDSGLHICMCLPIPDAILSVKMLNDYLNTEFNGKKHGLLPTDIQNLMINDKKSWVKIENWDINKIRAYAEKVQSDECVNSSNDWNEYACTILDKYRKGEYDGKTE